MKLYYAARTRATRPRWLLEELGAPYELVRVDLAKGEQKRPEFAKIHPHGAVPALVDGDVTLFESAAICAYLADKYPDKKLAPAVGTGARGLYYQWMVYSIATAEPPVLKVFLNTVLLPEPQRSAAQAEEGRKQWNDIARVLTGAVGEKTWLLGEQFTAADVMVGSIVAWSSFMGLIEPFPVLQGYLKRVSARPAFQRANQD